MLRLALMRFGVGNWKTIIAERVLPGKSLAQLVCQTQKLLGQQSLRGEAVCSARPVQFHDRILQTRVVHVLAAPVCLHHAGGKAVGIRGAFNSSPKCPERGVLSPLLLLRAPSNHPCH